MSWIDIILAIPLCYLIFKGYRRGLIYEVFSLLGLVLGLFLAVHFCKSAAESLEISGQAAVLVGFFFVFVVIVIAAHFLGKFIEQFLKLIKADFLNQFLGALLGMMKGVCILSVLMYYVAVIDAGQKLITPEVKEQSILYTPVEKTGNFLIGTLKTFVAEKKSEHQSTKSAQ